MHISSMDLLFIHWIFHKVGHELDVNDDAYSSFGEIGEEAKLNWTVTVYTTFYSTSVCTWKLKTNENLLSMMTQLDSFSGVMLRVFFVTSPPSLSLASKRKSIKFCYKFHFNESGCMRVWEVEKREKRISKQWKMPSHSTQKHTKNPSQNMLACEQCFDVKFTFEPHSHERWWSQRQWKSKSWFFLALGEILISLVLHCLKFQYLFFMTYLFQLNFHAFEIKWNFFKLFGALFRLLLQVDTWLKV